MLFDLSLSWLARISCHLDGFGLTIYVVTDLDLLILVFNVEDLRTTRETPKGDLRTLLCCTNG